jgi:hypothetical protein
VPEVFRSLGNWAFSGHCSAIPAPNVMQRTGYSRQGRKVGSGQATGWGATYPMDDGLQRRFPGHGFSIYNLGGWAQKGAEPAGLPPGCPDEGISTPSSQERA